MTLNQKQTLCLLCHAFLRTLPKPPKGFGGQFLSFQDIFTKQRTQKIKCILYDFIECKSRLDENTQWTGNLITITRRSLINTELPIEGCAELTHWMQCNTPLSVFEYRSDVAIENSRNTFHADFANKHIGGGVLRGGCVQEEIRFLISPECFVLMLVYDEVDQSESILLHGTEVFTCYNGYSRSFQCMGHACLKPTTPM